jgi:hypothetical protein
LSVSSPVGRSALSCSEYGFPNTMKPKRNKFWSPLKKHPQLPQVKPPTQSPLTEPFVWGCGASVLETVVHNNPYQGHNKLVLSSKVDKTPELYHKRLINKLFVGWVSVIRNPRLSRVLLGFVPQPSLQAVNRAEYSLWAAAVIALGPPSLARNRR